MIHSLILGNGEIGSSLLKVLNQRKCSADEKLDSRAVDIKDADFMDVVNEGCKVLHICFPYSDTFEDNVVNYALTTGAEFVIIHATVQVGTTTSLLSKLNIPVVHSPVQGQHPYLEESILYFDKFVGTTDDVAFELAVNELSNVNCVRLDSSEASELGKMFSTSYYGVCIAWHREMKRICDEFGVNFEDAATKFNAVYNKGYAKFNPNVIRPTLTPPVGPIGGHCVTQNARLLEKKISSDLLKLIV